MKTVYLIRHAKSSWELDLSDIDRPLNERGIKDAELIGKELKILNTKVDKVYCSPAERTRKTASIILEHLDLSGKLFIIEQKLYDFEGSKVIEVIKNCDDNIKSLMIFGHNYALTSISNLFGDKIIDNLPTVGVVSINFEENSWKDINTGRTVLTIFPKSLK